MKIFFGSGLSGLGYYQIVFSVYYRNQTSCGRTTGNLDKTDVPTKGFPDADPHVIRVRSGLKVIFLGDNSSPGDFRTQRNFVFRGFLACGLINI